MNVVILTPLSHHPYAYFHFGDQANIGKKYEVRDTVGNVYIADAINIEQAANTHGAPLDNQVV